MNTTTKENPMNGPSITLTPESLDNDIVIDFPGPNQRDNVWLTISLGEGRPMVSMLIAVTDEGIVADLYPIELEADGPPVASMYALDTDLAG